MDTFQPGLCHEGIEHATVTWRRSCRARFLWQLTQDRNMMMMMMLMRMTNDDDEDDKNNDDDDDDDDDDDASETPRATPNREPHHATGGRRD